MSTVDLHIHSHYSDDGELSPAELVALAKGRGLTLMSITDHNSVRGVSEALAAADDLRVLPGVELDCTYGGKGFHLLGYDFDHTRSEFGAIEADILAQERAAAGEKVRLFRAATDLPVDLDELLAAAPDGVVTGELIGEQLLSRPDAEQYPLLRPYLPGGEKSDMPNVRFYWDFFSEDKAAYVPIRYLSMAEAVTLLHSAGGLAVLAHPGQNLGRGVALPRGIIDLGIDGVEAFSSYHSAEDALRYARAAEACGLLVTCGSDFHGKHKPNIPLGGHGAAERDEALAAALNQRLAGRA